MRIAITFLLLFPFSLVAGNVGITKTFTSGNTLTATDLNGNVSALTTAINDNATTITSNSNSITNNDTDILSNQTAIANIRPALGYYANGQLIGWTGPDESFITAEGYLFGFDQTGTININILSGTYFESFDCTGQGYNFHMDNRITNGYVFRQKSTGNIVQIPANTLPVVAGIDYNSQLSGAGCNVTSGMVNSVYPIQANDSNVTGVQNSYTPPFHFGIQ